MTCGTPTVVDIGTVATMQRVREALEGVQNGSSEYQILTDALYTSVII